MAETISIASVKFVNYISSFLFRYENKGVQWMKSRADGLPPGLNLVEDGKPTDTSGMSKAARKNLKKKEKRMQAAAAAATGGDCIQVVTESMKGASISTEGKQDKDKSKGSDTGHAQSAKGKAKEACAVAQPEATEPVKKLKNLKKKLRQIEDLEAKVNSGEIKKLVKEQQDKIARKPELLKEIKDLERELQ